MNIFKRIIKLNIKIKTIIKLYKGNLYIYLKNKTWINLIKNNERKMKKKINQNRLNMINKLINIKKLINHNFMTLSINKTNII